MDGVASMEVHDVSEEASHTQDPDFLVNDIVELSRHEAWKALLRLCSIRPPHLQRRLNSFWSYFRLCCYLSHDSAPQMLGMLGNSYPTSGGPLSHGQVQAGNNALSMSMLNDVNPSDNSPFDMNDFPQLNGRPSFAGGTQGQLGSLRKQGVGVSSIVQQNQEFSIQNEDFPALPGFKDVEICWIQLGRNNNNMLLQQIQNSGPPSIGLRPMSSTYDQLMHQYQQQHPQNQFQFCMQQQMSGVSQSYRDQSVKSIQRSTQQIAPDPYGLLGLLNVIRMSDPELTSLSLGIDLTTLGLNLNSADNLYKTFGSDEAVKGETEYSIPSCYYTKQPPPP